MNQRYNDNKKTKAERKSASDFENLRILLENSAEGLGSRRERYWGYVSVSTPEELPQLYLVV